MKRVALILCALLVVTSGVMVSSETWVIRPIYCVAGQGNPGYVLHRGFFANTATSSGLNTNGLQHFFGEFYKYDCDFVENRTTVRTRNGSNYSIVGYLHEVGVRVNSVEEVDTKISSAVSAESVARILADSQLNAELKQFIQDSIASINDGLLAESVKQELTATIMQGVTSYVDDVMSEAESRIAATLLENEAFLQQIKEKLERQ